MSLRTPLCDLLQIDHPIMLAGMGGVSYAEVTAAVSNAGGFGTLGMAGLGVADIAAQVKKVKDLTDKPFGLDLLAALPDTLEKTADIIIDEGVAAFISGLGVPFNIKDKLQAAGVKVMNVCGTVRHAQKADAAGLDAVIAQGTEGGGHTGKVAAMALVPQVVDAVSIPVVAAGGVVDGRGLAAALALGAAGVWVGTRFIACAEAHAGELYKQAVLTARDEDTIVTRCYTGKTMRTKVNAYVRDWEARPQDIKGFPEQVMISAAAGVMGGIAGQIEGLDPERSCLAMGQGAGAVHEILPAREIIANMLAEAADVIARMGSLVKSAS
ncbi:MAG: NAD(P)H-dependent flavin oxidoreductase [Pseudomonadota bacterium]